MKHNSARLTAAGALARDLLYRNGHRYYPECDSTAERPSPASVAFGASFDGVATLSLFDVHGKLMFAQKLEVRSGDNRVDLPAERFVLLPPGVYQVALQTSEGVKTGRLVKI